MEVQTCDGSFSRIDLYGINVNIDGDLSIYRTLTLISLSQSYNSVIDA